MSDPLPVKISIATVTWNAGDKLERTINSVEEQDYPYVEHIVVDGNSQDNTMLLLHQYQERNGAAEMRHEINLISEPDNGLYDAMNKALQMATGDYILFLNAGDCLHEPSTLSRIAKAAEEGRQQPGKRQRRGGGEPMLPGVVYGNTHVVDEEGKFLHERRLQPPERLSWRSFKKGMLVCHQAFFARTDLAKSCPYNMKYRFSSDFDWCIRIMRKAALQRLPLQNAHLVVTDYLDGGLTVQNHHDSLRERFRIMSKHYGFIQTVMLHLFFVVRSFLKK